MMTNRLMFRVVLLLAGAVGALLAHEEFEIIGVVTKVSQGELEVKTRDGKSVAMGIGAQTAVTRNKQKSDLSQLKKGQNVVVTAFGDSYEDLGALQVSIVPTLPRGPQRVTPNTGKGK